MTDRRKQAKELLSMARTLVASKVPDYTGLARQLLQGILDENESWESVLRKLSDAATQLEATDKNHTWVRRGNEWYARTLQSGGSPGNYVIVVAEVVRGKSKGPKGFTRYKPYRYQNSQNSHPIVYADILDVTSEQEAIRRTQEVQTEMQSIMHRQDPKRGNYVKSFGVVLHDVGNDKPIAWGAAPLHRLSNKGYLYDGASSSNDLLKKWKIL